MKTTLAFLVIFLAFTVESAYGKKHKAKNVKSGDADGGVVVWPEPNEVRDFDVPPEFTASPLPVEPPTTAPPSERHRGKSSHKRKH